MFGSTIVRQVHLWDVGEGFELREKAVLLGTCSFHGLGVAVLWVQHRDGAEGAQHLPHVVQGLTQVLRVVGQPGTREVVREVYSSDDVFRAVSMLVVVGQQ